VTHARGRSSRIALPLAALLALPLTAVLAGPAAAADVPTYRGYLSGIGDATHYTVVNTATGATSFVSGPVAIDGAVGPVSDLGPSVVYVSREPYAGGTLDRLHRVASGGGDTVLYSAAKDVSITEPSVSAGGTTVAFALDDPKSSAVLTVDVATKATRTLRRSTATTYFGPSFSPDGEYLSWAQEGDTSSQVVVARLETGAASVLSTSTAVGYEDTAWSPDGSQLALTLVEPDQAGSPVYSVALQDLRTGVQRRVLRGTRTASQAIGYGDPAWAPDSLSVLSSRAVITASGADPSLVRVATAEGSQPEAVPATSYAGSPSESGPARPSDSTAPAPVTALTATVGGATAHLTYTLPADADLADVLVTRTEGGAADTATASIRVGQTREVSMDVPLPAAGTDYGLSVFSRDWSGNLGPAAKVQVTSPAASTLIVSAPPARVGYRSAVHLTGRLTGATGPLDGQRVVLYARRAGTSTPVAVTSATTAADGSYALTHTPSWTVEYQVRYAGSDRGYPSASAKRVVSVVPAVSLGLSASRIVRGGAVTLGGSVAPSHAGALVSVQRYVGGTWRTIASTRLSAASSYRYVLRPATAGTWTLRVVKPADADHLQAVSPTRGLSVR